MQKGYLIGETPAGDTVLIESGDPREMRRIFKQSDGEGFVSLQVIESAVGRTRNKRFPKHAITDSLPAAAPAPPIDDEPTNDLDEFEVADLREIASGDRRKAEVKEAIARLAEIGIAD